MINRPFFDIYSRTGNGLVAKINILKRGNYYENIIKDIRG